MTTQRVIQGDCIEGMRTLPDASVHCCVTSPPYWGLRDYGHDGQIGLEATPEAYVARMVEVFREVRRVLRDDGTLWLNLGDTYATPKEGSTQQCGGLKDGDQGKRLREMKFKKLLPPGLKPKDIVGIPWRVAFALQADGWWLRQDIVWCLSGGTWLYVRTQKGDMPMTVKDVNRLDPSTVQLWNGEKWTQLLGMSRNERKGDELEITLRSGERISCTPTHKFPTSRGLLEASDITVGDVLGSCRLPEPENPKDCVIDKDAAWFAGLYLAEGSRAGDTIQLAGHAKEEKRWLEVQRIAAKFGGTATITLDGNNQAIRVYGKVLNALVDELVSGKTAKDKGFAPVVWKYSDEFIESMLDGYLSGDGHKDGERWRLGFCRNYNLERDLRTVCARLGFAITLKMSNATCNGKVFPTFRGELRKTVSDHHNVKDRNEVVSIGKARCRMVYDLGVADDPHVFALASGVLTHNSKPNPMPESVTDRCTKAHEYVFLLAKSARYFYDAEAVKECVSGNAHKRRADGDLTAKQKRYPSLHDNGGQSGLAATVDDGTRNRRSVWTITTKPYSGAHFAVMPPDLVEPCIKAGCPEGGTVLDPFAGSGTTLAVAAELGRSGIGCELNPEYIALAERRIKNARSSVALFEAFSS